MQESILLQQPITLSLHDLMVPHQMMNITMLVNISGVILFLFCRWHHNGLCNVLWDQIIVMKNALWDLVIVIDMASWDQIVFMGNALWDQVIVMPNNYHKGI